MRITDTVYQGTHTRAEVIRLAQEAAAEDLAALLVAESLTMAAQNCAVSGYGWVRFAD